MVKGATQKLKPRGVGHWDRGGLGEELRFEGRPPGAGLMEGMLEQAAGLRAAQTFAPPRIRSMVGLLPLVGSPPQTQGSLGLLCQKALE